MPKINIEEKELTTFAQFNATENSVLIPLFVTVAQKTAGRYTTLSEFKQDYPTGEPRLADEVDSEGVFRVTNIEGGVVSYWVEQKNISAIQSEEVVYFDKSYLMICELLSLGLTVIVKPIFHADRFNSEAEVITTIQTALTTAYDEFTDKNLWNIKFITSGAYPNAIYTSIENESSQLSYSVTGCYSSLRSIANSRQDCISLLEFERVMPFDNEGDEGPSLKSAISLVGAGSSYEAAFYPWLICNTNSSALENQTVSSMPACFGYLMAVANNAITNSDWLANSGTIRGRVPNLSSVLYNVGESAMHYLQGDNIVSSGNAEIAVNPIMKVGTYGIRIWGNRTTAGTGTGDNYTNFLNVRILLCDIKKQLYHASLRITFEPNDDIAWINFKKLNNTLLDQMQSGRGIEWYRWNKLITEKKATLKALLTIKPIEALEYFDITINLSEEGSTSIEESI